MNYTHFMMLASKRYKFVGANEQAALKVVIVEKPMFSANSEIPCLTRTPALWRDFLVGQGISSLSGRTHFAGLRPEKDGETASIMGTPRRKKDNTFVLSFFFVPAALLLPPFPSPAGQGALPSPRQGSTDFTRILHTFDKTALLAPPLYIYNKIAAEWPGRSVPPLPHTHHGSKRSTLWISSPYLPSAAVWPSFCTE